MKASRFISMHATRVKCRMIHVSLVTANTFYSIMIAIFKGEIETRELNYILIKDLECSKNDSSVVHVLCSVHT